MILKNLIRTKWFWILAIVAVGGIGIVAAKMKNPPVPEFSTATVKKTTLTQSVEEAGTVVADLELTLSFEISGKVIEIGKKVGDAVQKGAIIARLNAQKEYARLSQAVASLQSAKAALELKMVGATKEKINESQAAVTQAEAGLAQAEADLEKTKITNQTSTASAQKAVETAYNNLQLVNNSDVSQLTADAHDDLKNIVKSAASTLSEALTESDNILGVDNIHGNDSFENALAQKNLSSLNTARQSYEIAKKEKNTLAALVQTFGAQTAPGDIDQAATLGKQAVAAMQTHLFDVQTVLANTSPVNNLTQTNLEAMQSNINTVFSAVNTAQTNITNGTQAVATAQNTLTAKQIAYDDAVQNLEQAKKQAQTNILTAESLVNIKKAALEQTKAAHESLIAPPRDIDLASLKAEVARQNAVVADAQADVNKTMIVAPAEGQIRDIDMKIGEIVTANTGVVRLISSSLMIEVDISESDITKVSVNNPATFSLDAFGDERVFSGTVFFIEPAEKEVSGVIYYTTKISIDTAADADIRPGMTANLAILTDKKEDVFVIPQRAILEKDGKKYVRALTDQKTGAYTEIEVTTGLRGDEGQIEIMSGLSEGQEVITFIKE